MENDILELEEEIQILKNRVAELEKSNNIRKANMYLKAIIKICLFLGLVYGIWRGNENVTNEIPKIMEDKIKEINPLKAYD